MNRFKKILGHLNINKLSVIGFSDGGIVAYRLAALGDLHIEKLVTISSRWNIKDALLTKDMFLAITPENYREEFPKAYETYQKLNPAADFDNLTGRLVKMWLDPGPGGYLNEGLKSIRCPLLIVRGDDDVILTRNSVVEIANLIEGSSLLNIPFATHPAFKQQKELFMISLLQFLKS
jgi:pimeloyl-ACP methyl ester carboxylesterase